MLKDNSCNIFVEILVYENLWNISDIYVSEQEYIVLNTSEKYIAIDINTIANTQNIYK